MTAHAEDERWPSGEFVVQSIDDDGLPPAWVAKDRPIENADVVLWYVFGIHHVPRPEEWPVMRPTPSRSGSSPVGFFDRNPALDVAPTSGHGAHCHHALSRGRRGHRRSTVDDRRTPVLGAGGHQRGTARVSEAAAPW